MKIDKLLEIVGRFDKLPDDAVVPTEVTAAVLGLCTKSVRDNPELPKRWVSPKRYGQSVRDIRRLVRNGIPEQDRAQNPITPGKRKAVIDQGDRSIRKSEAPAGPSVETATT
jgi:hypothetical protein